MFSSNQDLNFITEVDSSENLKRPDSLGFNVTGVEETSEVHQVTLQYTCLILCLLPLSVFAVITHIYINQI